MSPTNAALAPLENTKEVKEISIVKERVPPNLKERFFNTTEQARNSWRVVLTPSEHYEDVFVPSFWANVARRVRMSDIVEVVTQDHRLFALLYVINMDMSESPKWLKVVELVKYDIDATKAVGVLDPKDHEVRWGDAQRGFIIVRLSDGAILKENCKTKVEADRWLSEHLKAIS